MPSAGYIQDTESTEKIREEKKDRINRIHRIGERSGAAPIQAGFDYLASLVDRLDALL